MSSQAIKKATLENERPLQHMSVLSSVLKDRLTMPGERCGLALALVL
jgi:hypothetical protein